MAHRIESIDNKLELVTEEGIRLSLDFVSDKKYQRPHRGKNELIAKALGLSLGYREVWDLTAGLCEDSWFLLKLGFKVHAFERHPLLCQLIENALLHAKTEMTAAKLLERFEFSNLDSLSELKKIETAQGPETVYLDPMFSFDKTRSALPRKEMQIFRQVVGADLDAKDLLHEALRVAKHRVVVKRPSKESPLIENPKHRYQGTAVSYDLYIPREGLK